MRRAAASLVHIGHNTSRKVGNEAPAFNYIVANHVLSRRREVANRGTQKRDGFDIGEQT
jgi:hypothetical protein